MNYIFFYENNYIWWLFFPVDSILDKLIKFGGLYSNFLRTDLFSSFVWLVWKFKHNLYS